MSFPVQDLEPQATVLKMGPDERAGARECAAARLQMRVPQRPRMDHVRPDLQSDGHVGGAGGGRKARGISEQRLGRSHLDQGRRQAVQIGVERRDPGSLGQPAGT